MIHLIVVISWKRYVGPHSHSLWVCSNVQMHPKLFSCSSSSNVLNFSTASSPITCSKTATCRVSHLIQLRYIDQISVSIFSNFLRCYFRVGDFSAPSDFEDLASVSLVSRSFHDRLICIKEFIVGNFQKALVFFYTAGCLPVN